MSEELGFEPDYDPEHALEAALLNFQRAQRAMAIDAFIKKAMFSMNGKLTMNKPLDRQHLNKIVMECVVTDEYTPPDRGGAGRKKADKAMKEIRG